MAYKNKKEYKEDKRKWNNGPMQARMQGGYQDFRVREAAWLQMQALKDDDDDKKESKPKSSGKADRSSGKYDDIRKAQEEDRSKGSKTAQSFKNKKPEKAGISKELQKQLDALTLSNSNLNKQLASNSKSYEKQLAKTQAGYEKQLKRMQASSDKALQQMQAMMLSQQQQAANTQQLLQSQLSTANNALTEQKRVSANLANAYVPQAEASADTVIYGDSREQVRKQRNNQLSDLSIVTGIGNAGNAGLAGLQLAG